MWWARESLVNMGTSPRVEEQHPNILEQALTLGDMETAVSFLTGRVQQLESMVSSLKEQNESLKDYRDMSGKFDVLLKRYDVLHAELMEEKVKNQELGVVAKKAKHLEKEKMKTAKKVKALENKVKSQDIAAEAQISMDPTLVNAKVSMFQAQTQAIIEEMRLKGEYLKEVCDQQQAFITEHMAGAISEIAIAKWKTWAKDVRIHDLSFVPKNTLPNLFLFDGKHDFRSSKSKIMKSSGKIGLKKSHSVHEMGMRNRDSERGAFGNRVSSVHFDSNIQESSMFSVDDSQLGRSIDRSMSSIPESPDNTSRSPRGMLSFSGGPSQSLGSSPSSPTQRAGSQVIPVVSHDVKNQTMDQLPVSADPGDQLIRLADETMATQRMKQSAPGGGGAGKKEPEPIRDKISLFSGQGKRKLAQKQKAASESMRPIKPPEGLAGHRQGTM